MVRTKWGNANKIHSGKKSHDAKHIYIQVLFSADQAGISLKSSNWTREKGHPVNSAQRDDRWTPAGVLNHFWGHRPLWGADQSYRLSFPRKIQMRICLECQEIYLWMPTESAHNGYTEGIPEESNQKKILKTQWNARHHWPNGVEVSEMLKWFVNLLSCYVEALSSQENNAGQRIWLWKELFSIIVWTQPPANVKIDTVGKDNLWKLH